MISMTIIISKPAKERINLALALNALVEEIVMVPFEHKYVYVLEGFDSSMVENMYTIVLSKEPSCTCNDFVRTMTTKLYVPCRHIYFVFLRMKGPYVDKNMVIHQTVIGTHELSHVLAISGECCSVAYK
ncbi:hypothetical protein O6H91_Y443900 [Diphasiastrum complanatum]|nr:hypothetical protein O6H91_Y443900 [Diphasiastrum complanatum]